MNDRQYQRIITRLDLLEKREPPLAAEFVTTATDPADDLLVVAVGWDDGEHTFGPVRWSPMGGALPQAGDECVIVERDDGVWQVVGWWSDSQSTGVGQSAVDALDARLDALERRASGNSTATWTASILSAAVVIAHGLGTTPSFASAQTQSQLFDFKVTVDATNITVTGYRTDNTSQSSTIAFYWTAIV